MRVKYNPLLSVVIANYNYGRFLADAINSVVSQIGFEECELIIVDGGSTDNSIAVIKEYESQISWWVSEKDNGQSDAFNKGFAKARGVYGCWLNADDVLIPGALRHVISYLKRQPNVEWLAGSCIYCDACLRIWKCSRCVRFPRWLKRLMPASPVNGPSSFFRLENLRRLGGFDVSAHYVMDVDLWRRFLQAGIKLHMLKSYIWGFRLHEASKTAGGLDKRFDNGHGNAESLRINAKYGVTERMLRMSNKVNRLFRLISGAYLWSYLDTRRYRNMAIQEVFK